MSYRYFVEDVDSDHAVFSRWDVENKRMYIRMAPPNDSGWEFDLMAETPETYEEWNKFTDDLTIVEIDESRFNFLFAQASR